jgi:hypothetical protein
MFDLSQKNNKFILGGFIIIAFVILFYLHDYYTKKLIHNELKKIAKAKKKNLGKNLKTRQNMQKFNEIQNTQNIENIEKELNQQDMDSYIDPGAEFIEENNSHNNSQASSRLNSSNIMMRDMMDGL